MVPEFSARDVALQVVEHLERRRPGIVGSEAMVKAEVENALVPVRKEYEEYQLPASYFDALKEELAATLPARWRAVAGPFTRLEEAGFGLWRGGDVVARLAYVGLGLVLGGFAVWAPFIPIWEKWFPFAVAALAWFLPDLQARWHKRRYARELGAIVSAIDRAQPALDRHVTIAELLPPESDR